MLQSVTPEIRIDFGRFPCRVQRQTVAREMPTKAVMTGNRTYAESGSVSNSLKADSSIRFMSETSDGREKAASRMEVPEENATHSHQARQAPPRGQKVTSLARPGVDDWRGTAA
jgi:hypothetical protein